MKQSQKNEMAGEREREENDESIENRFHPVNENPGVTHPYTKILHDVFASVNGSRGADVSHEMKMRKW